MHRRLRPAVRPVAVSRGVLLLAVACLLTSAVFTVLTLYPSVSRRGRLLLRRVAGLPLPSPSLVNSLTRLSRQTTEPRGIVLPLYDDVALLGISLILELRAWGVDLPIEVPHCGDLDAVLRERLALEDPLVRVYDVCAFAATHVDRETGDGLFCDSLDDCHTRFRGFNIKVLALLLSQFDEVMLMDADTLYFQSPMSVWQSKQYQTTGTLFFNDRISGEDTFLTLRRPSRHNITHLEQYLSDFDPEPFKHLDTVALSAKTPPPDDETLSQKPYVSYEPSAWLRSSHVWNRRAGHQADSSLMLWNKRRQPRATAILGSFIAYSGLYRAPSYGDKEFYFIACELADSAYAFSDFGTGGISTDVRDPDQPGHSVLCGDAMHFVPEDDGSTSDPTMLYINSDHILDFKANDDLYRTVARPASLFPGLFGDRGLPQECPFDVTVKEVNTIEKEAITRRHQFHSVAQSWRSTALQRQP